MRTIRPAISAALFYVCFTLQCEAFHWYLRDVPGRKSPATCPARANSGVPLTKLGATKSRSRPLKPSLKPSWKSPKAVYPSSRNHDDNTTTGDSNARTLESPVVPKPPVKAFVRPNWKSSRSTIKSRESTGSDTTVKKHAPYKVDKCDPFTSTTPPRSTPATPVVSSRSGDEDLETFARGNSLEGNSSATSETPKSSPTMNAPIASQARSTDEVQMNQSVLPSSSNTKTSPDGRTSTTAQDTSAGWPIRDIDEGLFSTRGANYATNANRPPLNTRSSSESALKSTMIDDVATTLRKAKAEVAPFRRKIQANIAEGNVGERGEEWALAQAIILLCVALGTIPIIGGLLTFMSGPGFIAGGVALVVLGVGGLGDSLSPWPAPVGDNKLCTTGVYGIVRHPTYTGLLMLVFGFGVVSSSPTRMLLALLLALVLDRKADKEEEMLVKVHEDAYKRYRAAVAKFVPRVY